MSVHSSSLYAITTNPPATATNTATATTAAASITSADNIPNVQNILLSETLTRVARGGDIEAILNALNSPEAMKMVISGRDELGNHFLKLLVSSKNLFSVKALMNSLKHLINVPNYYGNTCLTTAASSGASADLVKLLLANAADPDQVNSKQETSLMHAIRASHEEIVPLLITTKNINQANKFGWTAVMMAARCGYASIVSLLIARGATITQVDTSGFTALDWAEYCKHTSVVEALKPAIASLSDVSLARSSYSKLTVEERALLTQLEPKYLAQKNFNFSDYDDLIDLATSRNQELFLNILIKLGADTNQMNWWGALPLESPVRNLNIEMVRALLNNGAKADPKWQIGIKKSSLFLLDNILLIPDFSEFEEKKDNRKFEMFLLLERNGARTSNQELLTRISSKEVLEAFIVWYYKIKQEYRTALRLSKPFLAKFGEGHTRKESFLYQLIILQIIALLGFENIFEEANLERGEDLLSKKFTEIVVGQLLKFESAALLGMKIFPIDNFLDGATVNLRNEKRSLSESTISKLEKAKENPQLATEIMINYNKTLEEIKKREIIHFRSDISNNQRESNMRRYVEEHHFDKSLLVVGAAHLKGLNSLENMFHTIVIYPVHYGEAMLLSNNEFPLGKEFASNPREHYYFTCPSIHRPYFRGNPALLSGQTILELSIMARLKFERLLHIANLVTSFLMEITEENSELVDNIEASMISVFSESADTNAFEQPLQQSFRKALTHCNAQGYQDYFDSRRKYDTALEKLLIEENSLPLQKDNIQRVLDYCYYSPAVEGISSTPEYPPLFKGLHFSWGKKPEQTAATQAIDARSTVVLRST